MTGLTLPGMMEEPGWTVGEDDFEEAAARAGAEPADVVGDLEERDGDGCAVGRSIRQAVAVGVGLEVVLGLDERDAGFLGEHLGDLRRTRDAC